MLLQAQIYLKNTSKCCLCFERQILELKGAMGERVYEKTYWKDSGGADIDNKRGYNSRSKQTWEKLRCQKYIFPGYYLFQREHTITKSLGLPLSRNDDLQSSAHIYAYVNTTKENGLWDHGIPMNEVYLLRIQIIVCVPNCNFKGFWIYFFSK